MEISPRIRNLEEISLAYTSDLLEDDYIKNKIEEILFGNKRSIFSLIESDLFWTYYKSRNSKI